MSDAKSMIEDYFVPREYDDKVCSDGSIIRTFPLRYDNDCPDYSNPYYKGLHPKVDEVEKRFDELDDQMNERIKLRKVKEDEERKKRNQEMYNSTRDTLRRNHQMVITTLLM